MPTPTGDQFKQLQLFDDAPYKHKKDRGEMSMDEWLRTQKPVYHGTFREDFHRAPTAHYGTLGQAATVMQGRMLAYNEKEKIKNLDYDDPLAEKYEPEIHDSDDFEYDAPVMGEYGRVYARRFTERPHRTLFGDEHANAGDVAYRYLDSEEEYEIPKSLKSSAGQVMPKLTTDGNDNPVVRHVSQTAAEATSALSEGKPIKYANYLEGRNEYDRDRKSFFLSSTPISYVAPRDSVTSWERDVLESPRASDAAKRYAQQRIDSGREGAVAFPTPKPEMKQTTLFYKGGNGWKYDGPGLHEIRTAKDFPRYSEASLNQDANRVKE